MKVIFIKDLKHQGKKDEIKEVKDGFAKYLITEGYAVKYTTTSANVLDTEIKQRQDDEDKLIASCEKIKKELEKLTLVFKVKTGSMDKVFGSISSKQISEELKNKGFEIDKKKIKLDSELNTLGVHNVNITLHRVVNAQIRVNLVK